MNKRRMVLSLGLLALSLIAVAACSTPAPTATPEPPPSPTPILTPEPFSLTVLYTNDGWGYTEPCACEPRAGGLAKRAAYIKSVREQKENVLVVDAGDSLLTLQRVGDLEQGKLLAESFNQMGYDAVALGGLDFRMGLDVLREQIGVANFAVLSANALDPQTQSFFDRDYVMVQMHGHKIAIIGLTDTAVAREVTQGQLILMEPVQSLADLVALLQDEADIIIVLSHLGAQFDMNLGLVVDNIDVVISGQDKQVYNEPVKTSEYLLTSAGSRGEFIGQLDLDFDAEGKIVSYQSHMQRLTEEIADDPAMRQWLGVSGIIASTAPKSGAESDLSK
ncbi:MAG: bifunctional metallophosphatase/5'-nucleotidase [Anaerolineae bacterium]|nr:bifunctional metallophosphatase/5'-nucleotidase [Anaerolineae bacterium]